MWLEFRGGKGVATGLGVFLAFNPLAGIIICGVWLLVAGIIALFFLGGVGCLPSRPAYFRAGFSRPAIYHNHGGIAGTAHPLATSG